MQSLGLLEDLGRGVHQAAHRAPAAIINENLDRAEFAGDPIVSVRYLRFDSCVALDWERDASARFDLAGGLFNHLGAAGDQRHLVARREAQRQRHAQTFADADHNAYLVWFPGSRSAHNYFRPPY